MCVEMFVVGDDVIVNEIAPRPHNSGHLTIDAFTISQFEQQLRAVCGLPLGDGTALCQRGRDGEPARRSVANGHAELVQRVRDRA